MTRQIVKNDYRCAWINWETGPAKLMVSGETTNGGGEVMLSAHQYVDQPDYWVVEVLWDRTDALFTSITPFSVEIDVATIQGKKGITLVGERMTTTFEWPDEGA